MTEKETSSQNIRQQRLGSRLQGMASTEEESRHAKAGEMHLRSETEKILRPTAEEAIQKRKREIER